MSKRNRGKNRRDQQQVQINKEGQLQSTASNTSESAVGIEHSNFSVNLRMAAAVFLIFVAGFLAYSNSFTISFQFDDTHTVQSNIWVRSLKNLPRFFWDTNTTSYRPENSGYRPMTTTALALGFALSGSETWGYHLIKLIEHCLVGIFILLVGLKILPGIKEDQNSFWSARFWIAAISGLIFVVHRANTETVDYICAVSTLQAGLFYIIAFYLYLRWRELQDDENSASHKPVLYFSLSVLFYFLGNLSKEEAITLPGMIFVYEWIYHKNVEEPYLERLRNNFWTWLKVILPYVAAGMLFAFLRYSLPADVADTSRGTIPTWIYFITQWRSWLYYWTLFFWPVTLNADNLSFDFSTGLEDPRIWGALFVHLIVWGIAWRVGRRYRFVRYAILWIYITVLPASSVFRLVEAVNEHRMYIPYMFLSLLSVWSVYMLAARWMEKIGRDRIVGYRIASAVILCAAVALGIGAHERNEIWQTDISLWEDVLAKNPTSPRAMNVLGVSLINRGEFTRSTKMLEECHRIAPTYLPCVVHLSISYSHFMQYDKGLEILKKGYAIDPNYPHINFHLGIYYKEYYGDFPMARFHFNRVYELTAGRFFQASLKLAEIELEEGRIDQGMEIANGVLQIDMGNGDAWEVLGKGYLLRGDFKSSKQIFEKLLTVIPDSPKYLLNLVNISERSQDFKMAQEYCLKIVTKYPETIQAWKALARVAEKLGNTPYVTQANENIEKLKAKKVYGYYTSLFMVNEKARQIASD